jgi:hypothetical protein
MMKYRLLQWKELGAAAVVFGVILWAVFELGRAILRGVIDVPTRSLDRINPISLHDYPSLFWFSVSVWVVGAVAMTLLFAIGLRGKIMAARNIKQKLPMVNRWTGRF